MALEDRQLLEKRSEDHWLITQSLTQQNNEWAAVTAFYSCYQMARAALLHDPVFSDLSALKDLHWNLTPDERTVTHHNAHIPGRTGFGIVDLVHLLYKHVGATYRTLHRGSNEVRYGTGLSNGLSISSQIELASEFRTQYKAGTLIHEEAKKLT
jgi:hypothetical protein